MTDFFPFQSYRQHQRETIDKIQELISIKNVKNILLEMPTGSGKSPVAISTGLWSQNAYCLTSQKILQDQYIRDFIDKEGYEVSVLKGRGNYECNFLGSPAMCNECYEPARKKCYKEGVCLYQNTKRRTAASTVALMNYAYFLNVIECDPSELFKPRKLLICDEAHNIESELLSQVEFLLSEFMFKRVGHVTNIPTYGEIIDYQRWMEDNIDFIQKILSQKTDDLSALNLKRMRQDRESTLFLKLSTEASELTSQIEELDRLVRRTKLFLSTLKTVEWVFTVEKTEKLKMKKVIFRPLTIDMFAEDSLLKFGEHRLYMSATILDSKSFCKSLGINHDESVFIRVPSTFPVHNRKIFFTNTGYMNIDNIDETLPNIVKDVKRALDYHKLEKGIVHCNSYKISQYIENNCIDSRLIFHDSISRAKMLDKFLTSNEPLVLVSPSMTEGVDLKDDLARWEIIVKIPYLYIGDKQIAKRMKIDPEWYVWQTCLTLVQSYGRIFRSESDWGTAYIFDSGARSFIKRNSDILPDWFLEACVKL